MSDEAGTYADRYPETRGKFIWCIECGEDYAGEALDWWQYCPKCARWWRENPPPGEEG